MAAPTWKIVPGDLKILRDLARRKVAISQDPVMAERRRLWLAHDAGHGERPMVLAEVGGVMGEVLPDSLLQCQEGWARGLERGFRVAIYEHEELRDDHVITPEIRVNWAVKTSDYGVQAVMHHADNQGKLGARRWDAPIKDLDRDFAKLKPRTFSVDREGTLAWQRHLEEVFGGIAPVVIRGTYWWTLGMTIHAVNLIGLEELMLAMYDNPQGLHRLMAFLRDDHLAFARWLEREGLLTLNNENDYIGSGSMGYSAALPQPGLAPGAPARLRDLWVLSESQETVGVSAALFKEFIYPYQRDIVKEFGACYYGCCEPVHSRWDVLRTLPNLKRVSVSPWCDQAAIAASLRRDQAFSRKPNPTLISTERFNEAAIRADLCETLRAAAGCNVELIMKDVHTLNGERTRLARWVALAREGIEQCWG